MDPQDDPEARIRELERPLTDQARTSELGVPHAGGYRHPPTPPPVSYGAPFPLRPRRTTAASHARWIVFAVFGVGAAVVAGGLAVFGSQLFSGGGSIIGSPSSRPGISSRMPQVPTVGESTSIPPPGGELSVSGVGETKTIACNDSLVSVSGVSNTVVVTGHCASLTVSGVENVVTVDAADTITASGFDNQVTFHSGSPRIDKSGESNVVQQG